MAVLGGEESGVGFGWGTLGVPFRFGNAVGESQFQQKTAYGPSQGLRYRGACFVDFALRMKVLWGDTPPPKRKLRVPEDPVGR